MKVLVTGVKGQLGYDVMNELARRGYEGVGVDVSQAIGIEDAYSGIAAIKAAKVLPIGVGKAEVLGTDIALVSDTSQLTLDFLTKVWENK